MKIIWAVSKIKLPISQCIYPELSFMWESVETNIAREHSSRKRTACFCGSGGSGLVGGYLWSHVYHWLTCHPPPPPPPLRKRHNIPDWCQWMFRTRFVATCAHSDKLRDAPTSFPWLGRWWTSYVLRPGRSPDEKSLFLRLKARFYCTVLDFIVTNQAIFKTVKLAITIGISRALGLDTGNPSQGLQIHGKRWFYIPHKVPVTVTHLCYNVPLTTIRNNKIWIANYWNF